MKKIIIFLIPLFLLAFSSKYTPNLNGYIKNLHCDKVLHKQAFDICYSCSKKEPNVVAYDITKTLLESKHNSRKGLYFHTDYQLPKKCRSYSNNYTHSGYDRGHNAPNVAFSYDRIIQKQTFLMSNIAPQAKWLNRRYWAKIERLSRYLAVKYGKVQVITGNCGTKGKLKNNVNIPAYWFKIIQIDNSKMRPIAFLAPNINKGMKKAKIKAYQVNILKVKKVCGF